MTIGSLVAMSIVVMVATTFTNQASATGAACQLYGHSCLGGHGKRSSNAPVPFSNQDSDTAVDTAAMAAFQAKMNANRLSNVVREMIARRVMASAGAQMTSFNDNDLIEK